MPIAMVLELGDVPVLHQRIPVRGEEGSFVTRLVGSDDVVYYDQLVTSEMQTNEFATTTGHFCGEFSMIICLAGRGPVRLYHYNAATGELSSAMELLMGSLELDAASW